MCRFHENSLLLLVFFALFFCIHSVHHQQQFFKKRFRFLILKSSYDFALEIEHTEVNLELCVVKHSVFFFD